MCDRPGAHPHTVVSFLIRPSFPSKYVSPEIAVPGANSWGWGRFLRVPSYVHTVRADTRCTDGCWLAACRGVPRKKSTVTVRIKKPYAASSPWTNRPIAEGRCYVLVLEHPGQGGAMHNIVAQPIDAFYNLGGNPTTDDVKTKQHTQTLTHARAEEGEYCIELPLRGAKNSTRPSNITYNGLRLFGPPFQPPPCPSRLPLLGAPKRPVRSISSRLYRGKTEARLFTSLSVVFGAAVGRT